MKPVDQSEIMSDDIVMLHFVLISVSCLPVGRSVFFCACLCVCIAE